MNKNDVVFIYDSVKEFLDRDAFDGLPDEDVVEVLEESLAILAKELKTMGVNDGDIEYETEDTAD